MDKLCKSGEDYLQNYFDSLPKSGNSVHIWYKLYAFDLLRLFLPFNNKYIFECNYWNAFYMHNYTHDIEQYTWFNTNCFPSRKSYSICRTVVSSILVDYQFSWILLSFSPWKLMFNEMQFLTKKCINRINTGHKFQYPWNWFFTKFTNINETTVHLQYSIKNATKYLNTITCTCRICNLPH